MHYWFLMLILLYFQFLYMFVTASRYYSVLLVQCHMFVRTSGPISEGWKMNLITALILLMVICLFILLFWVSFRKLHCPHNYHFLLVSKCTSIKLFMGFHDFKDLSIPNIMYLCLFSFLWSFLLEMCLFYLKVYCNSSLSLFFWFIFSLFHSSLLLSFFPSFYTFSLVF